jgi:anti-sigma28 factor (negative regulator of flagellin synthesis)
MDTESPDNPDKTAQPAADDPAAPQWWRRLSLLLASLPEVEDARVEKTSRAIRNGSFEIDTDRVAVNLLAFERQRLKSG